MYERYYREKDMEVPYTKFSKELANTIRHKRQIPALLKPKQT